MHFLLCSGSAYSAKTVMRNSANFWGFICSLQFEIRVLEKGEVGETSSSFLN